MFVYGTYHLWTWRKRALPENPTLLRGRNIQTVPAAAPCHKGLHLHALMRPLTAVSMDPAAGRGGDHGAGGGGGARRRPR